MKHTPGPWRAVGNKVKAVDHGETFTVADCRTNGKWKHTPEGEANNARLIAASPTMYDLLQDSLKTLQAVSEYFLLSKDPRWIGSRASGLVLETLDKLVAFEEKK